MWLNYMAMFICAGCALYLFSMAAKYDDIKAAALGAFCAGMAGLNLYLLEM